ncbi:MAG: H(+)/Cl(-) exchange transporter ClcA [Fimbriimonadaceae bacterium]
MGSGEKHDSAKLDHRVIERRGLALAAVVGLTVGLVAVTFQLAVEAAEHFDRAFVGPYGHRGILQLLGVVAGAAALGGLAGWITQRFCPEAGGSGIPYIKAALMNLRPMRPIEAVLVKIGGGLLALTAGMSLGREGPTVQIGGSLGSLVATSARVPERLRISLIASGAGAGLAAAFNAPLAGFIFVMEELRREMSPLTYGLALIASVCAVAVTRAMLGQAPSFLLIDPKPVPMRGLGVVLVLGMVAALVGVAFNLLTLRLIRFRSKHASRMVAGIVVGGVAGACLVYFGDVTGAGHNLAETILRGGFAAHSIFGTMALLLVGKMFLTSGSFASGVPGGIFTPLLVVGAVTGNLIGYAAADLFPSLGVQPDLFATIGMASVLSGAVRAPLTGVVLIVEMTQQYSLLYALLVGAFTSYVVANLIGNQPVYEALLERELHRDDSSRMLITESITLELNVEPDSAWDGATIKDLKLPAGALITVIKRDGGFVAPRGNTSLAYGDEVSVFVVGQTEDAKLVALHDACRAPHPADPV